jgi:hypothetical protein
MDAVGVYCRMVAQLALTIADIRSAESAQNAFLKLLHLQNLQQFRQYRPCNKNENRFSIPIFNSCNFCNIFNICGENVLHFRF